MYGLSSPAAVQSHGLSGHILASQGGARRLLAPRSCLCLSFSRNAYTCVGNSCAYADSGSSTRVHAQTIRNTLSRAQYLHACVASTARSRCQASSQDTFQPTCPTQHQSTRGTTRIKHKTQELRTATTSSTGDGCHAWPAIWFTIPLKPLWGGQNNNDNSNPSVLNTPEDKITTFGQ